MRNSRQILVSSTPCNESLLVLDIVGIWEYGKHIYILRKHPGIAMLTKEEKEPGNVDEDENEESRDQ